MVIDGIVMAEEFYNMLKKHRITSLFITRVKEQGYRGGELRSLSQSLQFSETEEGREYWMRLSRKFRVKQK